MLTLILDFASSYLLGIMGVGLGAALIVRYFAYRSSRDDAAFYSTFTREVEKKIGEDGLDDVEIANVDSYLDDLLEHISNQLPKRTVRSFNREVQKKKGEQFKNGKVSSLREYVGGSNSLIHGIQAESTVFKSHHPPSFGEVTDRVMGRDEHWVKLYGLVSIDKISRLIDALPGMFIVIGIFGTFLGISNALPQIANIDFSNIEASSNVLGNFVLEVTFAMKTSIAGILCSLVLSVINTIFPLTKMRDQISIKVENTLENLWYFFQGETPEKKRDAIFVDLLNTVKSMEAKIGHLNSASTTADQKLKKVG
ncbi:MAG: hypothetical protein HN509_08290 [Halobacteriovoraceae bacterium]|nr:hypothetical protein [Halobacteriovoraceae bacterium]MBT5094258.1 hypothetical protein [Halobacteriovoraceae bacterium]